MKEASTRSAKIPEANIFRLLESSAGQGMVEFVILLIIIAAVCTGMLVSMRLLTYQFWAQQEARFLAFEQTWVPYTAHHGGPDTEAIQKLENGARIGRPDFVSRQPAEKDVHAEGSLSNLLAWMGDFFEEKVSDPRGVNATEKHLPVLLADGGRSIWFKKSAEWFQEGNPWNEMTEFVQPAYARQSDSQGENRLEPRVRVQNFQGGVAYRERLAEKVRAFFEKISFGEKICESLSRYSSRKGNPPELRFWTSQDCAKRFGEDFSAQLSRSIDVPEFFRGYGESLQSGFDAPQALEISVRTAIANQFYSFFDKKVKDARGGASGDVGVGKIEASLSVGTTSVLRMLSEARYIGSSAAVSLVVSSVLQLSNANLSSHSVADALQLENSITEILHIDAEDAIPLLSPFVLSPAYLPVPPAFGSLAGGIQEAVFKNLMSQPEDNLRLFDGLEHGSQEVEVKYDAAGGVYPGLQTVKGANEARLSAKFFLLTQPWHLERRSNGVGKYREKGTETDSPSDDTEEGILRRHLIGLWMVPVDVGAFIEPVTSFVGLDFLAPAFQALQPLSSTLAFFKRVVVDNPFFDAAQSLSKIPVIGDLIPVPPRFPAVRPDAYPGSVELHGMTMESPDKMILEKPREFKDYVEEQQKNDPKPDPKYN